MSLIFHKSARRAVALTLCCLVVTALFTACQSEPIPPVTDTDTPTPTYKPFVPEELQLKQDDTDYRALALTVFEGVTPAAAEDFTYELREDDTLCLTAYHGAGGTVVLPDTIDGKTVAALGDGLFQNNLDLTALAIPTTITQIGTNLLTGCRFLTCLQVPQLGAVQGEGGFLAYFFGADRASGMGFRVPSSLDTLILLDTLTYLDENALLDCSRLRLLLLPDTLTAIGDFALYGCSQLHFAPLPSNLTAIGEYAFANCTSLWNITLPASIEHVGLGALMGCTSLQQLTLPFLGQSADATQAHLGYIFGAEHYTWNRGYVPSSLKVVKLTAGDLADYAFYDCSTLACVALPEGCTRIGIRALWGCAALQQIDLPDSLTTIDELAFVSCTTLPSVDLPAALQTVGLQAFMGCSNLTKVSLPDSLRALPASAFANCYCLGEISLGGVREVGAQVFRNCYSLKTVTGNTANLTIADGNDHFKNCIQ